MKKQRRHNETDEVAHVLDVLSNPQGSGAGDITPIYDQHYGETYGKTKKMKSEDEDDTVCVIVDNELYCVDKEEL